MTIEWALNVLAFAALIGAGIVPLYIAVKGKIASLRILSFLLGGFAVAHGLYHLTEAYGIGLLSDVFLEPTSVVFLIAFGLYYSRKGIL